MLTYFPEIISGELLYSVLARYSAHEGLSGPAACAADLFGLKHAVASVDLPNRLDTLASRIGLRGFDGARLAREHTLLPYYTAYQGETIRQLAEERLRTGRGEVHLKLGLAAFSIARETVLRFCPECFEAMIAERGEAWWRRAHQLPGVLVCPDHGCPLRRSTLDTRKENRHRYLPATEANCPADAAPACRIADEADRERFLALARASAALLDDPPPPRDFLALTERYRRRLRAVGLMRWQEKVDLPALDRAMRAHWGRRAGTDTRSSGQWPVQQRLAFHACATTTKGFPPGLPPASGGFARHDGGNGAAVRGRSVGMLEPFVGPFRRAGGDLHPQAALEGPFRTGQRVDDLRLRLRLRPVARARRRSRATYVQGIRPFARTRTPAARNGGWQPGRCVAGGSDWIP